MNIQSNIRMSEQQYDAERSKIARTKNEAQQQAGVRWEQQLAALFYRSGWMHEQLARKEGVSSNWICKLVVFGRFLTFCTTVQSVETLPNNLSERRFRSYWRRTEKGAGNERVRFQKIIELMQSETTLSRSHATLNHGAAIKERFADGKWHSLDTIADQLDVPKTEIEAVLNGMYEKGTYNTKTDRKRVGPLLHYRIFPKDKAVSVKELKEKLTPIIKELTVQGRTNAATVSISSIRHNAARLQQLLDEWLDKEDDD